MKTIALVILLSWLIAVIAGRVLGLDPNAIHLDQILQTTNSQFWLGTDDLGRDILARLLRGVEVSVLVALVVTCFSLLIGVSVGLFAGYYGGWVDRLLMEPMGSDSIDFNTRSQKPVE